MVDTAKINKKSIYVGCSLTHAPLDFVEKAKRYKKTLTEMGYEVLDFVELHLGSPEEVYRNDILRCVRNCDAFIGICDYPAIGLGYELSEATRFKKPILALAKKEAKITRMLVGASIVEPNITLERYKNLTEDGVEISAKWIESI